MDKQQKTILVTGASRGIGHALSIGLVQRGHRVIALARSEESLLSLEREANEDAPAGKLTTMVVDITDEDQRNALADRVAAGHQVLDGVVHNAGALLNKPMAETSLDEMQRLFAVNFFAPVVLSQQLLPFLKASSSAHVVHVGSMGGYQGSAKFPGLALYSASKGALATFAECLAEEWKPLGIASNCVAIGAVQTEMLSQAFPDYTAPVSPEQMGNYLADFVLSGHQVYNGKVLPVSVSVP